MKSGQSWSLWLAPLICVPSSLPMYRNWRCFGKANAAAVLNAKEGSLLSLSLSLESNIEPILWRARFGSRFTGIIARDTLSHFHFFSSLSTFFFLSLSLFHFHSFSLSQTKLQQVYGSWESKACERLLFSLSHPFALSLFHTFTLSAGSRFTGKQRDSFSLSLFHTYTVFSFSLFHTFTLSLFLSLSLHSFPLSQRVLQQVAVH